jgi:uncharacterized membrane protein YfcA
MHIYLPIAEVSVNILLLLGLGGVVGILSGMFGVGGAFILTPLLFFIGIPPTVAVATGANQTVASSFSSMLAHLRRKAVDVKMGALLTAGGLAGSLAGVQIFATLKRMGQIETVISLSYVILLGGVGILMLRESLRAIRRARTPGVIGPVPRRHQGWVHRLPFKMRFRQSQLYMSVLPPLALGAAVGVLSAIMGVGGGFIMVPAMIYLLGMPTRVVVGTSLLQITVVAGFSTLMHAWHNQTVDAVLATLLIVGGVIGAQFGTTLAGLVRPEKLRLLLALLVLAVGARIALDLVVPPAERYSISEVRR